MSAANTDHRPAPELPDNPAEPKRVLEAVLLSAREPLSLADLKKVFADQISAEERPSRPPKIANANQAD